MADETSVSFQWFQCIVTWMSQVAGHGPHETTDGAWPSFLPGSAILYCDWAWSWQEVMNSTSMPRPRVSRGDCRLCVSVVTRLAITPTPLEPFARWSRYSSGSLLKT